MKKSAIGKFPSVRQMIVESALDELNEGDNFWHDVQAESDDYSGSWGGTYDKTSWDLPKYIRRASDKNRDAFRKEEGEGLRSAFRPSERKDLLGSKRRIKMLADKLFSGTKTPVEIAQTVKQLELALFNLKNELRYWGDNSGVSVPDSNDVDFS